MNIIICGAFTYGKRKPCKTCERFSMWGINTGYCFIKDYDVQCWNHCKYYKRDSRYWLKNGKCKIDENKLYC